jgi:hypothetical protein
MIMAKRVVTKGGGENLYKIVGSSKLEIFHVKVGTFSDTKSKIGSSRNLEDALSIIKSHSGSQIKYIREW